MSISLLYALCTDNMNTNNDFVLFIFLVVLSFKFSFKCPGELGVLGVSFGFGTKA